MDGTSAVLSATAGGAEFPEGREEGQGRVSVLGTRARVSPSSTCSRRGEVGGGRKCCSGQGAPSAGWPPSGLTGIQGPASPFPRTLSVAGFNLILVPSRQPWKLCLRHPNPTGGRRLRVQCFSFLPEH
ncbi:hypothetical protein HJG60_009438 [Phyllostomus discolor]|uniref:Uncharacterized protein n=1 Tax=Phyllostomus discolor TaxID=89673 RepID=A0A833YGH1_9CHIR|nr:hypothetical protein HJG60_009438 [Phyllostomus discolor]